MNALEREELDNKLRSASPLELVSILQEAELYDAKSTRLVVDEIYQEFQSVESLQKQIIIPVFTSIADGFLECSAATKKLRRKGLTASKIVSECRSFSYKKTESNTIIPEGYTEWKNINDFKQSRNSPSKDYKRDLYEDTDRLNEYKRDIFSNNGGRINATDEYTGERNVYQYRNNPDARRNIEKYKHDHQAEVDHIVPLKQIHEKLKNIYVLTDDDIKNIANDDINYALTSARINRGAGASGKGGKFDSTNTEFVEDQRKREREGLPNLGISEEAKDNMLKMEKDAQKTIYVAAAKQTGEVLSKHAAEQSKDYLVGNVIMFIIKPLYYEISDIIKNGLKNGVNATSVGQAFKIRFGRVKDYVLANAMAFMGNSVWDFVKGFVSSLIEGFISLFVGIFKQILKLMKEGIRILIQSGKVLFGKESAQMSSTEKGDAIIKIIGGGVISICGIALEALMNKLGIPEPWSVVLSTIGAGIASVLFMMMLDKMDLFSVKAEMRQKRIDDIFSERINDIKLAAQTLNTAAMETLRTQFLQFSSIKEEIMEGVRTNSIDAINDYANKLAEFFKVELPYKTTEEFVVYMNSKDSTEL